MRAYFFNNYYVAGIRAGIQAAHAIDQMWLQFADLLIDGALSGLERIRFDTLREFSRNHKTFVVLHAGDHAALNDLASFFATGGHPYPWASFAEPGLNHAITSVAVIVPERLYDEDSTTFARSLIAGTSNPETDPIAMERRYSDWEIEFLKRRVVCSRAD